MVMPQGAKFMIERGRGKKKPVYFIFDATGPRLANRGPVMPPELIEQVRARDAGMHAGMQACALIVLALAYADH